MKDQQDDLEIRECDYCSEPHPAVVLIVYEDLYWCRACRECFADYMEDNELTAMQKHAPPFPTRPA